MDHSEDEILARACSGLSHPLRVSIVRVLAGRSMSTSEIAMELGRPVSNVSYHMEQLVSSGLVRCMVSGRWHNYTLDPGIVGRLWIVLGELRPVPSETDQKPL